MNEFDNKTWKQAFNEVEVMYKQGIIKQLEINKLKYKELKELLNKTK